MAKSNFNNTDYKQATQLPMDCDKIP